MRFIKLVVLAIITVAPLTACADKTAIGQGEAVINVDGQTYELPLVKCYSAESAVNGKLQTVLIISSHQSRMDKALGPRFTIVGAQAPGKGSTSKSALTKFSLGIGGGVMKGGIRYTGLLPIDNYQDNKLHYKGQAESLKMDDQTGKALSSKIDIDISVVCN